jgi:hypothetical protein
MRERCTPKIVAFSVVSAFIGTLLILHTPPVLAQAPKFLAGGHL